MDFGGFRDEYYHSVLLFAMKMPNLSFENVECRIGALLWSGTRSSGALDHDEAQIRAFQIEYLWFKKISSKNINI